MLDAFDMGSMVSVDRAARRITGYCRNNNGGVPENFHNYFVAEFDRDFDVVHTWGDHWTLYSNTAERTGNHTGAIVGFSTSRGEQVHVKVASSFISPRQAELNLEREIGDRSFGEIKTAAYETWNRELGRIVVEDDHPEHIRTFYSCLYRLLLFPRMFHETGENGEIVHYSPYNGKVLPGYMFTDNGFWDTFRAVFPFFNLMYPSLNSKIMQGLVNTYKESGWLPEWASPGHRDCMIGSNSAPIIADAYIKGVRDFDAEILLEAMLKNATVNQGRPVRSAGREGVNYYNSLGYVPYDVKINENAARTLEYAYADFAIARMAGEMGQTEISGRYYRQSYNYKNLYDPVTGWMRGKNADGSFQSPFNPLKWGDAFTEGNSLHYTWSVFHDIQGLIDLIGGDSMFVLKLDSVFTMPPDYDDSYYGFTIHEIREMQVVNMGNYAHGNQPVQHMIYLYNYARQPWKTQQKVREVMEKLYSPEPDGYCGDEDNGQTSAWFVFSSMGFYPVTPATTQYVIGSPLFDKVTLHTENGNEFTIVAENNDPENVFITAQSLNGKQWDNTWIDHSDIMKGGSLRFRMGADAGPPREIDPGSLPYSLSVMRGQNGANAK
jgi:predicted alpha-1,2-mannosidase